MSPSRPPQAASVEAAGPKPLYPKLLPLKPPKLRPRRPHGAPVPASLLPPRNRCLPSPESPKPARPPRQRLPQAAALPTKPPRRDGRREGRREAGPPPRQPCQGRPESRRRTRGSTSRPKKPNRRKPPRPSPRSARRGSPARQAQSKSQPEEPEARPEESRAASLFMEPGALTSVIFQAPDLSTVVRPAPVAAQQQRSPRTKKATRTRTPAAAVGAAAAAGAGAPARPPSPTPSRKAPRKRATKAPRESSKTA